jgi:flagellar biosynthetic protein FlhB
MVAGVGALWFCASTIGNGLQYTTTSLWSGSSISATPESILETSRSLLWTTIRLVLPFLISIFVLGTLAHTLQTRFLITRPKISFSAVVGKRWLENFFSFSTFGQIMMASPKVLLSLVVGATTVWAFKDSFFAMGSMPVNQFASSLLRLTTTVSMSVALTLLACSIFDYAAALLSFNQRMRMTDQEMREELRGQTGDPQIARIQHERMREITRDQT